MHWEGVLNGEASKVPIGRDLWLQVSGEAPEPKVEEIEIVDGKIEENTAFWMGCPATAADDFKSMGDSDPGRMLQKGIPGRVVALDEPIAHDETSMGCMFDQATCRLGCWSEWFFHQQMKAHIQGFQGKIEMGVVRGGNDRRQRLDLVDEPGEIGPNFTGDLASEVCVAVDIALKEARKNQMRVSEDRSDVVHAHASRADNQNTRR